MDVQDTGKKPQREFFTLGIVGPPFGLDGFVKVRPFSGETGHFSGLKSVILRQGGKEKTWEVAEIALRKEFLLLRFVGVDNPEAAALLNAAEIIVPREYASPLNEGEYYVEDLKGLEVVDGEGQTVGRILDILEGGGGQLAEIEDPSGAKRLAPFRNEFFGEISLEKGTIVLLEPWIID